MMILCSLSLYDDTLLFYDDALSLNDDTLLLYDDTLLSYDHISYMLILCLCEDTLSYIVSFIIMERKDIVNMFYEITFKD